MRWREATFFCAPQQKLIVELDGSRHDEPEQRVFDKRRAAKLQDRDYRVLRVWNNAGNLEGVLEEIWRAASNLPSR